MSDDLASPLNVFHFPPQEQGISEEERARRILVAAEHLAGQPAGVWTLWYEEKAAPLGITPEQFAELIKAQIAAREKAAAEKPAQEKLSEQRAERQRKAEAQEFREKVRAEDAAFKKSKTKAKAFADVVKLSADQHDGKIEELAKLIAEDVEALKAEFADYCAAEIADSISSDFEESWPEPVTTAELLEVLVVRINRHIIAKPHEVLIIALWIMMAWIHEATAHYSTYLVLTSPVPGCGKTTGLELIGRMVPRPYTFGAATTAIFRLIDREKPTLLGDNVDTLFQRKPDLAELFMFAYTRGVRIPRMEKINGEWITVWYDPFCPKAVTLIGTNLPEPLISRSIVIELWKMKLGETVEKVDPLNPELIDEFKTLRRKLRRWTDDHADTLKAARPAMPTAFINRPADIWILAWAIADTAGADWAQQARDAAERLSEERIVEPSWLERLVSEFWTLFVEPPDKEKVLDRIPSEDLAKRLTADHLSIWNDYGRGHPVTQREIAALLRKLHVHPRGISIGKRRVKGYYAGDFFQKQVFERILGRDPDIRSRKRKAR
jgi:uncharacterized protein DUF3631